MKKTKVALIVMMAIAPLSYAESEFELISSESVGKKKKTQEQTDNTRIYLSDGAIWATRDLSRIDPVLNLTVSDRVEILDGKLSSDLNFNISTNYSEYIVKWELEIFDGQDKSLSQVIGKIEGELLSNNSSIVWNGESKIPLKEGNQLLFRLKAWDHKGNMDVTTLGVANIVKAKPIIKDGQSSPADLTIDKLSTETRYATNYGRASLMRHNIPTSTGMVKLMGVGLKDVEQVYIGEEQYEVNYGKLYVEKYLPTGEYSFPIKVVYEDSKEIEYKLDVIMPSVYYEQAGLADLYLGKNNVSGNDGILGVDYRYEGDIYNQGRIAYFGQGKFGDHLKVTAHFDSKDGEIKDLFKSPFAASNTTVFDILEDDDELYYGNYGDNSNIEKVVNTKGKFYLDVQYDKSNLLWGNFNTGLTGSPNEQYDRSLYGLKLDYKTNQTTKFGDDSLNIVGFASETDTLSSHDEFLGTGGSLYFLKHGEVVPGSDKVVLKVVDSQTGLLVSQQVLMSGKDYQINPYQGRIILSTPLSSIANPSNGTVINDIPSGNYQNYLSVDYEYVPSSSESLNKMATGGRVKGWLNDNIGLGVTAIKESKNSQDYEIYGADLTLRATEGTFLEVDIGRSKGTQSDSNFVSLDGGLTFAKIDSLTDERSGNNISVRGVTNLYDLMPETFGAVGNDVSFWYKNKDLGYSNNSRFDNVAQESYGAELRLQFKENAQFILNYKSIDESSESGEILTNTQNVTAETQIKVTDNIKVAFAGSYVEELNSEKHLGKGVLAGGRIEYWFNSDDYIYTRAQKTAKSNIFYDDNDSVSVGFGYKIYTDWTLAGDYTKGDRGDLATASINYDVTEDYSTYVTYTTDSYQQQNNVILGQKYTVNENLNLYQENQFVDENNGKGRVDSYGFDYDINNHVSFGAAYQEGIIRYKDDSDVKRQAFSIYTTLDQNNYNLKSKFEYRIDDGLEKIEQIATINSFVYKFTDEYTLYGKGNYSRSYNKTEGEVVQRFLESSIGIAYRPIYNDDLNLLARYTYLMNYDTLDRDVSFTDEKSHIIEGEFIYTLTPRVDLGSKFAYKKKEEVYVRSSGVTLPINTNIYLTGINITYHIINDWDATTEYHWKKDTGYSQLEHGALVSVNKNINDNFKLGIGYNFSKFTNDLVHEDNYDAKGFFINVIGKF